MTKLRFLLLAGCMSVSFASTSFSKTKKQAPHRSPEGTWCTSKLETNTAFGHGGKVSRFFSFYGDARVCVQSLKGVTGVSVDSNGWSFDWKGQVDGRTEAGWEMYSAPLKLIHSETLPNGEIASIYQIEGLDHGAALGVTYNPKSDSFSDKATYVVASNHYYEKTSDDGEWNQYRNQRVFLMNSAKRSYDGSWLQVIFPDQEALDHVHKAYCELKNECSELPVIKGNSVSFRFD